MSWPRPLAVVFACFGPFLPALALASDLSWVGPGECADREQLLFQIERALGAPLAGMGRFHLQVHVERAAPDARAILRIADEADPTGVKQRVLVAPDCVTLVDTLAVAIALAIDPDTSGRVRRARGSGSTRFDALHSFDPLHTRRSRSARETYRIPSRH